MEPYFADELACDPKAPAGAKRAIILAQGISNGSHELTIRGPLAALKAIRVYRPPMKGEPPMPLPPPQ